MIELKANNLSSIKNKLKCTIGVPEAGLRQKDWNADKTDENNADKNGSKSIKERK